MARRAYRMTPRRRAALRKAQAASARKRRGHGRKPMSRKRKVAMGVVAGAAVGAAAYRAAYVPIHHNTSHANAQSIKKQGFGGPKLQGKTNASYFVVGRNNRTAKSYGKTTVSGRISRRQLRKVAHKDPEFQRRKYRYIHNTDTRHIKGTRIKTRRR